MNYITILSRRGRKKKRKGTGTEAESGKTSRQQKLRGP